MRADPMAAVTNEQIVAALKERFRQRIPGGREIAQKAVAKALSGREKDVRWIKRNFSSLVERVQIDAYEEYLSEESRAGRTALADVFLPLVPKSAGPEETIGVIGDHFFALDRFFLSLTQGRRPRAGSVFEFLLRELFARLGYPFTPQPVINGQPDFVMPSLEYFQANAPDCIIFTAKRTLRERWRQIVTEGTRGLGFFLATIDEDVGPRDVGDMLKSRVTMVVPGRIKKAVYGGAPNVISFERFFRNHLDPAMKRWRHSGVL